MCLAVGRSPDHSVTDLSNSAGTESGTVHGRWRAIAVPPEQIASAEEQLVARLQQALGPERYVDYEMATSDT